MHVYDSQAKAEAARDGTRDAFDDLALFGTFAVVGGAGLGVGDSVWLVGQWDRGCCFGITGVFKSQAAAAAVAAALDDTYAVERVIE